MSHLAKKPIAPGKAEVSFALDTLTVKGAKATLTKRVHPAIAITISPEGVQVSSKNNSRLARALAGTYASHVKNMVQGVQVPYLIKLILEGVGYKAEVKGKEIVFAVGKSHKVTLPIPADVAVTAEKNLITLTSADKESVGQLAANIRSVKPPEPYLGKGIRYEGEIVRRKQGKKAV
ncbi:50S ribosomal protein L6 [Candidatus Kaiserbacteria bacterium]|nr:50S ribosomal protein L6 [Candidatus Kaiserbacteria bacterium]